MGIKRNKTAEPQWYSYDYAEESKNDLFSTERWKETADWGLLLEQVKKTENACQLIDEYIYPSRLFSACVDILEANLYILDDLFYFLTGIKIGNKPDSSLLLGALLSLRFWNMDCYKEMDLIYEGLDNIENHLIECLKQKPLWEIADGVIEKSRYAEELKSINRDIIELNLCKNRAYSYACDAYREAKIDKNKLVAQIVNILNLIENYKIIPYNFDKTIEFAEFGQLLESFRQSEKGQYFIEPWRRDFNGSRDNLIAKMEKNPVLGPWVNRYDHIRKDEDAVVQLFCDDMGFMVNREECCNTDNWISLLTIAAVLQEYDEQHAQPAEKPARKPKASNPFAEFINDTPRSKAVLKRLHEIIDGKRPKTCALTIIAAVQSGIITQPTYKALSTEFPEIGDRSNYKYYLNRKNNYSDDIDSIAKGF